MQGQLFSQEFLLRGIQETPEAAFGLFRTKGDVLAQLTRIRAGTLQIAARERH